MKWLVAAACAVTIVAGGTYLNGVRISHAEKQAAIAAQQDARAALFAYAKARPDEIAKVEAACRVAHSNPEIFKRDMALKVVNTCNLAGISVLY